MRRAQFPGSAQTVPGIRRNEPDPQPPVSGRRGPRRVTVIHYEPAEGAALAQRLGAEGFEAAVYPRVGARGLPALRENPPDAVMIDLTRMPSYGRAMGSLLREHKATRRVPLVFVEGDPEKTELVRSVLPDAVFTKLPKVIPALRRAIEKAPAEPLLPDHSRVPLARKLRIQAGSVVALRNAPDGLRDLLTDLPEGARVQTRPERASLVITAVRSRASLGIELAALEKQLRAGQTVWLIWPKKSSGQASDLALPRILEMCSSRGLTGYMTCSVDATWSAVALSRRRRSPSPAAHTPCAHMAST